MAEFWERQRADEKTADFIEQKARLARRLNIPDERFAVKASTQGMREDIHAATWYSSTCRQSRHSVSPPTSLNPARDAPAETRRPKTMRP